MYSTREEEGNLTPSSPSSSEGASSNPNAGSGIGSCSSSSRSPAWKKPSGGLAMPVMGASSWPSLSHSSNKIQEHSPESTSEAVISMDNASSSISSQSPSVSDSDHPKKVAVQPPTVRQRPSPSPRPYKPSPQHRNHHSNQRFPPNQRGNGFHNKSHTNRRHHQPGFNFWNGNRGFAPRPFHHPRPHGVINGPGSFLQPPLLPPPPPYLSLPPPPVPDYRVPYGSYFQDVYPPLYYAPDVLYSDMMNGVPMYPQPLTTYMCQDHVDCCNALLTQIEYYFSDANLMTDSFLKRMMDEQGWVSVHLIATFRKVKSLTQDPNLILEALRTSTVVEVQGDKIRRRGNWMVWISSSGSSSPTCPTQNTLENTMQNLQLDERSETESMASKLEPSDMLP